MRKILFLLIFLILGIPALAADSSMVFLNTNRMIYHNLNCPWAHKCTKNCIKVTKQKAIDSGARPCKVCGG